MLVHKFGIKLNEAVREYWDEIESLRMQAAELNDEDLYAQVEMKLRLLSEVFAYSDVKDSVITVPSKYYMICREAFEFYERKERGGWWCYHPEEV